jgi:hypothetical protein
MPWINMTLRRGALEKATQHAVMAKLTDVLMWWEKVPDTPKARGIMKGWVYEVDADADYSGGRPDHAAALDVATKRRGDRVEKVLVAQRLGQKVDRARLHTANRHLNIAEAGHQDNRNRNTTALQRRLKIQSICTGKADV